MKTHTMPAMECTAPFERMELVPGVQFSISGIEVGRKGEMIVDGRNVRTKRKMRGVGPYIFVAGETYSGAPSFELDMPRGTCSA